MVFIQQMGWPVHLLPRLRTSSRRHKGGAEFFNGCDQYLGNVVHQICFFFQVGQNIAQAWNSAQLDDDGLVKADVKAVQVRIVF